MSVTGDFGRRAQGHTHRLIETGLAHFVASDSHDLVRRPPGLAGAFEVIRERWGEELALRLTTGNPRAVLEDRPLPAPVPLPEPAAGKSQKLAGPLSLAGRLTGRSRP